MPGPAIRQHLSARTEANFQEVAQIFRHDVVLYSGMLLSWAVLFDAEIVRAASIPFQRDTHRLQQMTQQFHDEARPRLHPAFPKSEDESPSEESVYAAWDQFYDGFGRFAQPRLDTLEQQINTYVTAPEFSTVIQQQLGTATPKEAIDQLMLQAFAKMRWLLDAEYFDKRVQVALNGKASTA